MTRTLAVALSLLLSSSVVAQQKTPEPLVQQVDVSIVNVDVVVTDSDGRPVTGLTRDDFEVFEDGETREISGFYAIENAAVKLAKPNTPTEPATLVRDTDQFRRKVVMMIDNNSMEKPHRDAAIEFVGGFLDNHFAGNYDWSVISVGPSVETLQPFTNDREAIRSALLEARRQPTYNIQRQADRSLLSDSGRAALRDREFENGYDFAETARFQSREQTMRNLMAIRNTARAVVQTCRAYAAAGGKKILLLVTSGMELNTTFSAWDSPRDRQVKEMRREVEEILDLLAKEANAANFNVYVVKAGGHHQQLPQHDVSIGSAGTGGSMKNPFFGEGFERPADSSDVDSPALTLALSTGGRYMPGKVSDSLEKLDEETSTFYSLAYSPSHSEDGRYHKIGVRLKNKGYNVQHRDGYLHLTNDQRLEMTLRAPLTYAKEKGSLPVTIKLGTPETSEKTTHIVPITVRAPMKSLTMFSRESAFVGRVHAYVTIYDETGQNVGFHHETRDLRLNAGQFENIEQGVFQYATKMKLEKGDYTIVVTLRDELSNEIGTALQAVRL